MREIGRRKDIRKEVSGREREGMRVTGHNAPREIGSEYI